MNYEKEVNMVIKKQLDWKHIGYFCGALLIACLLGGKIYSHYLHNTTNINPTHRTIGIDKKSYIPLSHNNKMSRHKKTIIKSLHPKIKASSSLVMDEKNGHILYQKNIHQKRKVASVAKLMTLYLVQRKANKLHKWNQVVHLNPEVIKLGNDTKDGLSSFQFQKNHKYTVRDLYKATVIASSNNSAIALGQWVAGSNAKFVKLMNEQARAWNLKACFVSTSGLENSDLKKFHLVVSKKNSANKLSALDIAIIARHLLSEYPQITSFSRQPQAMEDGQYMHNINRLLPGQQYYSKKLNVVGLKSGYTPSAGFNFIALSEPKGKNPLIAITLNDNQQFKDLRTLLLSAYHKEKNNSQVMN